MENWLNFYQHLPEHINPVVFKIGVISINWYSLMYLAAFVGVYLLLMYRVKCGEIPKKIKTSIRQLADKILIMDFMFYAILGVLVGGRLGYVLFYNLPYYLAHPLEIFLPIQVTSFGLQVTGIYGMSFHGGLIGVILAGYSFSKKRNLSFYKLADFIIPAIPAGYFFGRIGNFLNGELYGRATEKFWGMYFPSDFSGLLRHPSQLYEAFFEGLVLFIVLWILRNGIKYKNKLFYVPCFALYVAGYGFLRFFIEFFREPDLQVGLIFGFLTLGQLLSLAMVVSGAIVYFVRTRKNRYNTSTT